MNIRKNGIQGVAIWLFVILCFMGSSGLSVGSVSAQPSIRIASTQGLYSGLLFVAEQKGYFKEQGVDVEIIGASSGVAATEMLMEGTTDFCMLTEMAAGNAIIADKNLALLASTAEFDNSKIIARKDRGIMEPSDLKGKKIGIKFGSSIEYFLLSFLASHGLSFEDLVLVDVPANRHVEAVDTGEVDAIATWSPHTHRAVDKMGANGVHWSIQGIQKQFWLLSGLQETLPPLAIMQKIVRALIEAESFIHANEAEATTLLREYLELPLHMVAEDWKNIRFRVVLPRELLSAMEFEIKWKLAQQGGSSGEIPDYLDNMVFDVLEAERPESVTIMH